MGLRVGVEVGVECWAWGEAVTVGVHVHGGGCDRGYACCGKLLREYVEQVLALLLRRAGEVGGGYRTNARKCQRRAVRRMVWCAVRG